MKLVKQFYEILEQEIPVHKLDDYSGSHFREQYLENMYKHIERCGRTCYKSEDKITQDSSKKFVDGLIKSKHLSVLEHGTIYLEYIFNPSKEEGKEFLKRYTFNPYSKMKSKALEIEDFNKPVEEQVIGEKLKVTKAVVYVTTNFRVLVENNWLDDLEYLCEPTEYHDIRHTVLLHSCIHTYKDLTRHRKMSFSIESTRYCNYSKTDKFGEMKFVLPPWIKEKPTCNWEHPQKLHQPLRKEGEPLNDFGRVWYELCMEDVERNWDTDEFKLITKWNSADFYCHGLKCAEDSYNLLIELGWQPQQAAEVLPQCTAADVIMSGFDEDWKFVFDLRSDTALTGKPHPLVEEIMTPLRDEFKANNWI